jgi:hypothetical protein
MTRLKKRNNSIKPETIKLHKHIIPKTVVKKMPSGEIQATTKIGDVKYGWAACGNCHQHITKCQCKQGVLHPPSIEHFLVLSKLRAEGNPMASEGKINTQHHDYIKHGFFWIGNKRVPTGESLHDLRSKSISATKPNRSTAPFPKTKPLRKRTVVTEPEPPQKKRIGSVQPRLREKKLKESAKRIDNIDTGKVDKSAAGQAKKGLDDLMAKLDEPKKSLKKKGK